MHCPETPQKQDTRLKNEIGMNVGNQFLPPLTCRHAPLKEALSVASRDVMISSQISRRNKLGRFCRRAGQFWQMYLVPVVGVQVKSKIIAVFCQRSIAGKDFLKEVSVQGNIGQSHPFGNHSVLRTPEKRDPKNDPKLHAQYDWTTGVPDNGNEWRKFPAVPRSYPLRSLVFYFV